MRLAFAVSLYPNQFEAAAQRFWRRPWTTRFRDSLIRREVSGYPNYLRVVWWRWVTLEWGV